MKEGRIMKKENPVAFSCKEGNANVSQKYKCRKDEFGKKCQYRKNEFGKKCQYRKRFRQERSVQ